MPAQPDPKPIVKPEPVPVQQIVQPPPQSTVSSVGKTWGDEDNSKKDLKQETKGVFSVNEETVMMYEIFSGQDKDYYFTASTKSIGQNFNLYKKVLIGDNYEEAARARLRKVKVTNPTKNKVACELKVSIESEFKQICQEVVNPKWQPEQWIPTMK